MHITWYRDINNTVHVWVQVKKYMVLTDNNKQTQQVYTLATDT